MVASEGRPTAVRSPLQAREIRFEIEEFNTEYALVLDAGEVERWPDFFTQDGIYRITARENYDAGLPVGLVWCDGIAMMKDRAAAVRSTMVYAPRYLRHYTSNVRVGVLHEDGTVDAESNYLVVETLMEGETRILQAGRYLDRFARTERGLRLKSRDCVYDTLLISNDIVYPI